jgi:hypothetical protein
VGYVCDRRQPESEAYSQELAEEPIWLSMARVRPRLGIKVVLEHCGDTI